MPRYIDRKSAFKALEIFGDKRTLDEVYERLEKIPTADVVERKKGKWETKPYLDPYEPCLEVRRCSVCKTKIIAHCFYHFIYCPNCGAEMEGNDAET